MADQGFTYIPVVLPGGDWGMPAPELDTDLDWTSLEFAERYGYGITTDPWGDVGVVDPPVIDDGWTDPNQAIVDAMTDAERAAYFAALHGDPSRFEDFTEEDWANHEWTCEDAGCQGWADHRIDPGMWEDDGSQFAGLWAELDALFVAIEQDPRLTAGVDAWAACMAAAGQPGLTEIWSAANVIHERTNAVWDEVFGGVDWETADLAALERVYRARLAEYTDLEIEIAVADWHCRDEARHAEIEHEVTRDLQQQFVDTHRAELDAYVEWVNSRA